MSFYNTWRKRLACERCRHLKVRCEYKGPTSDTCIRCEKSHTKCVIPNMKKKDGDVDDGGRSDDGEGSSGSDAESREQNAAYLQKIIKDAEQKLSELNVSPLRQALVAELYTVNEAEEFYQNLRENICMFPPIRFLKLPESIMEVDKIWPWLAIAMVTVKAMHSVGKSVSDIQYYVRSLYRNDGDNHDPHVALDRQLAFALICQFVLSYRTNNINALLTMHGMTVTTIELLERTDQQELAKLALNAAVVTILPYTFVDQFSSINQLAGFYRAKMYGGSVINSVNFDPQSQCDCVENIAFSKGGFAAPQMMEMTLAYLRADNSLNAASSFEEIARIIVTAIQSINQSESEVCLAYNEFAKQYGVELSMTTALPMVEDIRLTPFLSTFLTAKLNLLRKAAVRLFDLSSCTESPPFEVVQSLITQSADFCGQLFRSFAHVDGSKPFLPTSMLYHIPNALLCLQTMRYIAFAGAIDIDVRSDCLLNVVIMKWEELLRTSIFLRLLFNLVFQPLDMASVKIGQLDPKTNSVVGSGSMTEFEILYYDGASKNLREKFPMNQGKLMELLLEVVVDDHLQKNRSSDWFEQASKLTLPTVLKVLFRYA